MGFPLELGIGAQKTRMMGLPDRKSFKIGLAI